MVLRGRGVYPYFQVNENNRKRNSFGDFFCMVKCSEISEFKWVSKGLVSPFRGFENNLLKMVRINPSPPSELRFLGEIVDHIDKISLAPM